MGLQELVTLYSPEHKSIIACSYKETRVSHLIINELLMSNSFL